MHCPDASVSAERKTRKMGSGRVGRASLVLLLLIVVSVCAAGGRGRGLAEEKIQKIQEHHNAAAKDGTTVSGSHPRNLMVKTNDYGRYDPTPAFSRPHFKPIPH